MKNNKRSKNNSRLPKGLLHYKIRKYFKENPKTKYSAQTLREKLNVKNQTSELERILDTYTRQGFLVHAGQGRYIKKVQPKSSKKKKKFHGTVDMTRTGSAYILVSELPYDIHIPRKHMNTAMDGDTVEVELFYSRRSNKHDGRILKILKRSNKNFVGTLQYYHHYSIVYVDRHKKSFEIFIENDDNLSSYSGEKVIVEINEWRGKKHQIPWGRVIQKLNPENENDMEMKMILINHGFTIDFPEIVEKEAENLIDTITDEEIEKRRDMRDALTFTIDPKTAKDFDDALSIRYLENDMIEVGVHIADVTHYVKQGTEVDQEAYKRSTSVYLVDRVSPMLPENLSNNLCSLNPNEDKLTFSVIFLFDKQLSLDSYKIQKTVIHSDKRFSYEEAFECISKKKGELFEELDTLNTIAKKLRKERLHSGAISFKSDEVVFVLDEEGTPLDVVAKQSNDAHQLIEEFMLLIYWPVA